MEIVCIYIRINCLQIAKEKQGGIPWRNHTYFPVAALTKTSHKNLRRFTIQFARSLDGKNLVYKKGAAINDVMLIKSVEN